MHTKLSPAITRKAQLVGALTDKISKSRSIVITDHSGITHKQLETLRKAFKNLGAELAVVKNTLFTRAFGEVYKDSLLPELKNASAALFAYEDEIAPLRELAKFIKAASVGIIKFGLLGTTPLTDVQVTRMATLPTKQILQAQLVGQLKSPLYGLHNALSWNIRKLVWTLDAIKAKKAV